MNAELTRMSSKGQVVIPQHVREALHLEEGETLAVAGKGDTIILKRVKVPDAKELFDKVHAWGVAFAKRKGIKESDVVGMVRRTRSQ